MLMLTASTARQATHRAAVIAEYGSELYHAFALCSESAAAANSVLAVAPAVRIHEQWLLLLHDDTYQPPLRRSLLASESLDCADAAGINDLDHKGWRRDDKSPFDLRHPLLH